MSTASPPRSTPNGLIALLFHLSHAASQGQLDPGLVRELGKRIYTEIDACKAHDAKSQVELNLLSEAMARLEDTLLAARSHMLLAAIRRAGSTESPHPEVDQDPRSHEGGHHSRKIVRSILHPSVAAARIISGCSPLSIKLVCPWDNARISPLAGDVISARWKEAFAIRQGMARNIF